MCGVGTCALLVAWACGSASGPSGPTPGPGPGPINAVLVGAGDIGLCGSNGPESTARLLDGVEGTVFTAGDNAYMNGTAQQFHDCYDPSWGRHKARTRPAPGNHEYESAGAFPYFAYFGGNAGPTGLGYYSFSAGEWHVVSLNSNVPMGEGSPQLEWLRDDLSSTHPPCVAAIWHHPLYSVGPNGVMAETREFWRALYSAGADVIVNGHDHLYARFAPQTPDGVLDTRHGIREFVVGTGGAELYSIAHPQANMESVYAGSFGVLKLVLQPGSYSWQFLTTSGAIVDAGSDVCR
jgi:acid phosphatase type 7